MLRQRLAALPAVPSFGAPCHIESPYACVKSYAVVFSEIKPIKLYFCTVLKVFLTMFLDGLVCA